MRDKEHGYTQGAGRVDFRRRLLGWYRRHARPLPWRATGDAYSVWVSETMLQQTQVATVVPYFHRFLAAFPTLAALATAPEEEVLRQWEGLGYYRRARNLHRAAAVIVREHGGRFPRDPDTVRRLPGIGRYTAGAILSIAFDLPQPILEANTLRLHARLLGYRGDPRAAAGQKLLWEVAAAVLPSKGAGLLNQAMMELGSTICHPRAPRCDICPVASFCAARRHGLQQLIPAASRKPVIEAVCEAALVVRRGRKVLLMRRGERERWAGMWDFPRFAASATDGRALQAELASRLQEMTGVPVVVGEKLVTLKHGVTRFRITLDCYAAATSGRSTSRNSRTDASSPTVRWVRPDELDRYPLSVTARKLAGLLKR